jgi:hypothetical protein
MKRVTVFFVLLLLSVAAVSAQKKMKPWKEWSDKDAQKILNDSPWGQTQAETNTAEMFYKPTASTGGGSRAQAGTSSTTGDTNDRNSQGALNQATNVNFRIRFLSARPIRQAFARRLILQNPQAEAQLTQFAEQKSDQYIVIAVDFDSQDNRFAAQAMQAFSAANIGTLKNSTYLETKGGQRIFLADYRQPIADGMGAKFVFPRMADNEQFVTEKSGYLRFYSEVSKTIKLNMRFNVSDMLYEGQLEY